MNGKRERRSYVRHPLTLYVDQVQFDPEVYAGDEVRTAYDVELNEYEMLQIYEQIKQRINSGVTNSIRIRIIGRLV